MLKVVVFSGGRGSNAIIKELMKDESIDLSLIINAYDDGKSTGEIRRFFNMLGPSDIRKNQENLMSNEFFNREIWSRVFAFRFPKDVEYEYCMKVIGDFVEAKTDSIVGIEVEDSNCKKILRKLLGRFIDSVKTYEKIVGRRFDFSDCSLSNCIYAGAYELTEKDFYKSIRLFDILLHTRGEVIPTNLENKKLVAIRENGDICYNEAEIVELRSNVRIKDIFILDEYLDRDIIENNFKTLEEKVNYLNCIQSYVHATAKTIKAIEDADVIIYAPGTQHSSLYPSYTILGVPESIFNNKRAVKVLLCNIGEDYETPGYAASEFITGAYKYLTRNCKIDIPIEELINFALVNTERSEVKEDFKYVTCDKENLDKLPVKIVYGGFESPENLGKHDAAKTIEVINNIYYKEFFEKSLYEVD